MLSVFWCGFFLLGSDPPLVAAPVFAFLVSFDGFSHFIDFLGSVVFAGLLEWGAGLFNSCHVKGTKETAKVKESCQKAGFDFAPQVMTSCLRQLGSCNVIKISAGQHKGGRAAAWHLTFVVLLVYFVRGCGTLVATAVAAAAAFKRVLFGVAGLVAQTASAFAFDTLPSLVDFCVHDAELDVVRRCINCGCPTVAVRRKSSTSFRAAETVSHGLACSEDH